jgi:hypothetical protein
MWHLDHTSQLNVSTNILVCIALLAKLTQYRYRPNRMDKVLGSAAPAIHNNVLRDMPCRLFDQFRSDRYQEDTECNSLLPHTESRYPTEQVAWIDLCNSAHGSMGECSGR